MSASSSPRTRSADFPSIARLSATGTEAQQLDRWRLPSQALNTAGYHGLLGVYGARDQYSWIEESGSSVFMDIGGTAVGIGPGGSLLYYKHRVVTHANNSMNLQPI